MATMLSIGTWVQLACPLPPTPITAKFNRLFGEHLIKLGIINAPVPAVTAVFINDLLDKFFIPLY
jgi:hypothetical protein